MSASQLILSLYQIGAVQLGNFTLKSGQQSSVYINLRKIISFPPLLRSIAELMWQKTRNVHYDLVCGVPYTALPIATCLSLDHDVPMIMRRKEKKEYGTKQLIEGVYQTGQRCLVIEDIITTGSSILETTQALQEVGLEIQDVIALIDREQGGKENVGAHFNVHTLLTISHILNTLLTEANLPDNERELIEAFLKTRALS